MFLAASFVGLIVFATPGDLQRVPWLCSGAVDEGLLQRVDDRDIESRVLAPDPATDEDVRWTSVVARKEMTSFSAGGKVCRDCGELT